MKSIFLWIQTNPQSFRGFLITFLSMGGKIVLQLTGKSAQLDHFNDAVSQILDFALYGLSFYGVVMGSIHATRGPALTDSDHISTVVAAIKSSTPVAQITEEVKAVAQEVQEHKPDIPPLSPGVHKF